MKKESKKNSKEKKGKPQSEETEFKPNNHLGSSNAFEETENPLSRDPDNISDELLDELLEDD
jgi:hypothetical protein